MLKSLIIIAALSLNVAFAKTRFTDVEKKNLSEKIKKDISNLKKKNNTDKVTVDMIKSDFDRVLSSLKESEKATPVENDELKKKFDDFKSSALASNLENDYYKFVDDQINALDKKPIEKTKEGKICNNWGCEEGLTCAFSINEEETKSCKEGLKECKEDKDCCSLKCKADPKSKKKSCEKVARCFRPVPVGQSCAENPVCASGSCLPYNSETSGIGECVAKGKACDKNSQCCSNSCVQNRCVDSLVCKDCAKRGEKPSAGKKCCEGLYKDSEGHCVPDAPPTVLPQVRVKERQNVIEAFVGLFISNANAGQAETYANRSQTAANALAAAKARAAASDQAAKDARAAADALATQLADAQAQCTNDKRNCFGSDSCSPQSCTHAASLSEQWTTADQHAKDLEAKAAADAAVIPGLQGEADTAASNAEAASAEGQQRAAHQLETAAPTINLTRKSDFKSCDVHVRDDFFMQLQKTPNPGGQGTLWDLEMAMLAFDYVLLNDKDGVNDYWLTSSDPKSSLFGRLHAIAVEHQAARKVTNDRIAGLNDRLTCMCIDAQGMSNVSKDKQDFFKAKCNEYTQMQITAGDGGSAGTTNEGASGIKGKRLIVHWTQTLQDFNATLAVNNSTMFDKIKTVNDWVNNQDNHDWGGSTTKTITLFGWNTDVSGGFFGSIFNAIGSFLGMTYSIDNRSSGASASPMGVLRSMIGGAWYTGRPTISDTETGSHDCEAWTATCKDWRRDLIQPYNNVCNYSFSSHACVKNFVIYDVNGDGQQIKYIIDPWIPYNVDKTKANILIKDSYARNLNASYDAALGHMRALAFGRQDNYDRVNDQSFFDRSVIDSYFSQLSKNKDDYLLKADLITEIKLKAKQFAVSEQFFLEGDTENLAAFADYAFTYHFIYPKTSYLYEISYPPVGLQSYLMFMTNGVAGNSSVGDIGAVKTFGDLNQKYLQDYLNTLMMYRDQAINQKDPVKLASLTSEITWAQNQLNNQMTLNALMNNTSLLNFNSSTINSIAKTAGVSGDVNLSGQTGLLNAIGTLRTARQDQLKKLDFYNKAMAASGNPDRVAQVAAAAKSFGSKFSSPISGGKGGGGSLGPVAGGTSGSGEKVASFDGGKNKPDFSKFNMNYGGSIGGSSAIGSRSTKPAAADKAAPVDEDSQKLADAINARDKTNKDKYSSNEETSLFEKVTNAYIRNYDKILTKRKDKEIQEQE